jgi:hypothetical protein
MDALINTNDHFRGLVAIYGRPKEVGRCGDPASNPGDICMESDPQNGKKLIMRCNNSNGCTEHDEIPV